MSNGDWPRDEVEVTVADYYAILESELRGGSYSNHEALPSGRVEPPPIGWTSCVAMPRIGAVDRRGVAKRRLSAPSTVAGLQKR